MTTKADFTEDEWKTLQKGVMGSGMLVSIGDRDFTDSFGEASALAKQLASQRQASESTLIRDLASTRKTGFGMTDSPAEVQAATVEALRSAVAILVAKAPDEVDAYRALVLGVATAVAEAKSGVSAAEAAVIEAIREAVGAE